MVTAPRRPTDIARMQAALAAFVTEDGVRQGLAFRPEPDDVIISTYPKCGTTWVQQIVHGLRTRGSMDFDEITLVVPWIELAHDMGLDLQAPQVARPRAFKSHLDWEQVPKGARYISVLRDPKDVLVSMYRFFEGWFFEAGSITLDAFARAHFLERQGHRRYWPTVVSWWRQRERPEVLLLGYEDMREDLETAVRRIAAHVHINPDSELLDVVVRQSSIDFMGAHARQFDDHPLRELRNGACGLPPGGGSGKVRAGGGSDELRTLSPEVSAALDADWRDELQAVLGYPSYPALREALSEEAQRREL